MPRNQNGGQHEHTAAPRFQERRNRAREHRKQQQQHQQNGDRKPLQQQRKPAKQSLAEYREQHALQRQNKRRGEQSAAQHREHMARKKPRQVGRIGGRRKTSGARKFASNRKPTMKIAMAATRARNSLRSRIGNVVSTKTSSRSGKNISHSKTVTMPIATKE